LKILRLELFGFKSFKDKTIITFDQAITAIVGSNGCGKSNVVDALYWVMGDMSPKHLRGSHMTDVIFSGSKDAPPLDMAEVTLVLERDPAKDPELPPQFQASNEIQITRRYYRSSEGEYLINKVPCRLRDIQEFFMDTGMGAKAYSIVEQGAISRLISLKPEDRRVIIEEVAGIMKFKARKAETLRKIENSKLNLQRIDDIVQDLQKQLTSLKRQADKAEKFKILSEKLKDLEIRLSAREWLERSDSKAQALLEVTDLKRKLEELASNIQEKRNLLQVQEQGLSIVESELLSNRENVKSLEFSYKDLQSEEANFNTRLESLEHRQAANASSLQEINSREETLINELTTLRSAIEEQLQLIEEAHSKLGSAEEESARLKEEVETLRAQLKTEEKELHRFELEQTKLMQEMQGLQRSLSQSENQKIHLEEQLANLSSEIELNHAERESTLGSLEKAFATRSELETQKHEVDDQLSRLENERTESTEKRDQIQQKLSRVSIRKEQLEALERNLDGIESAAKAVVIGMRERGLEKNLLADHLKIPALLEKSVEAVLEKSLQRIVAQNFEQVEDLRTHYLEQSQDPKVRQGRAPFWIPELSHTSASNNHDLSAVFLTLPKDTSSNNVLEEIPATENIVSTSQSTSESESSWSFSPEAPGPDGLLSQPTTTTTETPAFEAIEIPRVISARDFLLANEDVVGPLDELLKNEFTDENADTSWLSLLSGFWVLRSRQALLKISALEHKIPVNFVTLDGDVLYQNGLLDLAPVEASTEESTTGLIQRKRVIQSLKEEEIDLQTALSAAQSQLDHVIHSIQAAKDRFRELTQQLSALNPDVERYSSFLRQVEAKMARLSEKKNLLSEQLEKAKVDSLELSAKIEEITNRLSESEEKKLIQSEKLQSSQIELDEKSSLSQISHQTLNGLRNEIRSLEKTLGEQQTQRAALEQENNLLTVRKTQINEENVRFEEQSIEIRMSIEESSIKQGAKLSELHQAQDVLNETSEKTDQHRKDLKQLQNELDALNTELNQVQNRTHDLDQNVAVNDVELKNISEKLQEQYAIALENLEKEKLLELSTADNIEELADPSTGKSHALDLRRKIDNLGKINMVAIEEFEDVRARHEYLFIQREDLAEGIRQLKDAIDRIDRESRERFSEAYYAVNEAFKTTFPILFGGGNAELRLTMPDNMLETGVEIVAQPPGKKLQSVTLLSGGEKALTAVSLIFGIFSIKPSPFCVLDEVDAPLDDANVGRFNRLVRSITDRSQVIMITHHKKTMESCDALFGVTMERPGISKVASVVLGELASDLAN